MPKHSAHVSGSLFNPISSAAGSTPSIAAYLDDLVQSKKFSGLVALIKRGNEDLLRHGVGYADLGNKQRIAAEDRFRIASATKTFIAALVILLARRGLFELDERLSQYVPELVIKGIANADRVTIRQLLAMQSGICNYTDLDGYDRLRQQYPHHKWTADDVFNLVRDQDPISEPGAATQYSNTNYILLGELVETLTASPLARLLEDHIFKPLRMDNSYFETELFADKSPVQSYDLEANELRNVSDINTGRGLADGGIVSTVDDMTRFIHSLFNDEQFMSASDRAQMLAFSPLEAEEEGDEEDERYGLGLIQFDCDQTTVIGHDGSDLGCQSLMVYLPKQQASCVVLANCNKPVLAHEDLLRQLIATVEAVSALETGSERVTIEV